MRVSRILPLILAVGCAPSVQQAALVPAPDAAVAIAVASIQPRDFFARIGFLASDALRGRDTPSQGLEAAAAYISSEFHRMGLRPAGTDGYLQRWPFTTSVLDVAALGFEIQTPGGRRELKFGTDYYVAAGAAGPFSGGVVYLGADPSTADPQQPDVRGRAAAVYLPDLSAGSANRMRNDADAAGATTLIVILGPTTTEGTIASAAAAAQRPLRVAPRLPVFFLRHDRGRELIRDAGLDFDALTGPLAAGANVALPGITVHLGAPLGRVEHRPPNVVAMLTGSDPELRDTYVVFSAHFDHVGTAGTGSWDCPAIGDNTICNGADDNASGTAAVLELAEAFAMLPAPPRRSLIFLTVSGEEKGLLGSAYYAENPTVPVENIVANINVDMIGRNHPDSVVVIGQTYSSLGPLIQQVNDRHPELGMTVSDDLWPEQRFFFRSDHFNFARREIPAIFFFTGVHEDYHRPTDTADRIDLDKVTRVTQLIFHYGLALANDPEPPRWDPAGLDEVRRLTGQSR
jgi:hypothetical protein